MKKFESNFQSKDGLSLYAQGWEPEQQPKAIVVLIHGVGEHTGRYVHVGEAFSNAGYVLAGFDLRGHGKSDGARGHFPSLEAVMRDINDFFDFLRTRYPHQPFFLYGHSLGGLLVLTYCLKKHPDVKGVVATGPALRNALQEQKFKVMLVRVLGAIMPTITLKSELDLKALSRDSAVVDAYIKDPLVHDKITTGAGKSALEAIEFAFANESRFSAPLLVMFGSADRISFPSGGEEFVKMVQGDATFKTWDGMYHEIHNEPEKADVLKYMIQWMDSHMNTK